MTPTQKAAAPRPGILVRISRAAQRNCVWYASTAVGAVLAGLLSFLIGRDAHTWYDENFSLIMCQRPFREMMHLIAVDVHPPLYYLFLKPWCSLFGWTTAAERGLGTVFLALAVWLMSLAFGHAVGRQRAILVLPFLVFSPYAIRYGFEIRMYSLLMLEVAASTYALVRAIRSPETGGLWHRRKWWFAYTLSVLAGMYTQYLVLTVFVAQALLLLIRSVRAGSTAGRRRGETRDWFWVACYAGAVVCYLPWVPVALAQMGNPSFANNIGPMGPNKAIETIFLQLTGTVPEGIGTLAAFMIAVVIVVWIAAFLREEGLSASARQRLFAQVASQPGTGERWRDRRMRTWRPLAILVWMVLVPYLGLMAISWIREINSTGYYFARYALQMTLYFSGFLGLACADAALGDEAWANRGASAVFMPRPAAAAAGAVTVTAATVAAPANGVVITDDAAAAAQTDDGAAEHRGSVDPDLARAVRCRLFLRNHMGALCWLLSLCLVLGGTATVAVYKNTGTAYRADIGSNYGDVVASMTECSESHPVVAESVYLYVNYWDVFESCPAYYFVSADDLGDYAGNALVRTSGRQLRSLDDLADKGVTEFTYLTKNGAGGTQRYQVVSHQRMPSYGSMYWYKSRS